MRLKKVKGAEEYLINSEYVINLNNFSKNEQVFDNNNKVHIEIGTGKGKFLFEKAKQNKGINYIGVEKFASVLIRAVQKAEQEGISNLKFILCDAEELTEKFSNYFDKLYLNFSDPWPKSRHEKRRLTFKKYLDIYKSILTENHLIDLKTDNQQFFEYSVKSTNNYGIIIDEFTVDLHNSIFQKENIETEFEKRFSEMGFRINYMRFRLK